MNIGDPAYGHHLPGIGSDQLRGEETRVVRPYLQTSTFGPNAKTPPPALSAALNMQELLRGVWRNLGVALGLGLLLATATAVATWFGVPKSKYSARSTLLVSASPTKIAFNTIDRAPAGGGNSEFGMFQSSQDALLRSRLVLSKALSHPDVANLPSVLHQPDPIEWLEKEISISFVGEVLYIGLASDHPQEVVKLVNAVTNAYMEEVVDANNRDRKKRLGQLQVIFDTLKSDMKLNRETAKKLAERAGSNDKATVVYKQQLEIEQYGLAKRELRAVRMQLRDAGVELAALNAPPQAQPPAQPPAKDSMPADSAAKIQEAVEEALEQDAMIMQQGSRIAELRDNYNALHRRIRSKSDPAIQRARLDWQTATDNLKKAKEQLRQRLTNRYTKDHLQRISGRNIDPLVGENERNQLVRRIQMHERSERDLIAELKQLEEGLDSTNQTAMNLEETKDDIQFKERNAEQIGQEIENLKIELDAPSRVQLYEPATVARASSEKKRLMATGFAGISIFALVLLSVAWLDARVRRIDRVDQVVQGLGMELVGTLPPLSVRSRRALTSSASERDRNETGLLMEAVDSTRAMLMHVLRSESIRTVMVASAQKGEGKTSLACHLATSLARARQRTLLIDCDLRCPTIQMLFDLPLGPGVCEILRGESDVADIIQPTSAPLLSLLTAGRCDASAIESLAHGNLQRLFDEVHGQFDYIIVDSAPVLAVADSLQICQHVDAVLFSVLRDVSRLPRIYAAYEQLSRLGVRMLGVVVAGTQVEDHGYSYSYQGRTVDASHEGVTTASGKDRR